MPGFNKTGPLGQGAGTGRGRGDCVSKGIFNNSEYMFDPSGYGRGMAMRNGRGRGAGRYFSKFSGRRFCQYQPSQAQSSSEELEVLKQQANAIKNTLDVISERITELQNDSQKAS